MTIKSKILHWGVCPRAAGAPHESSEGDGVCDTCGMVKPSEPDPTQPEMDGMPVRRAYH